ncbi:MAG: HlyD family efflux transporter periplasmic adaptor subunit [Gemmatimonadaceae bacterium]|nr:HlyD family efflux transporter periplasmic adaptor subunit [Gemmatimonadaceae bacterium]
MSGSFRNTNTRVVTLALMLGALSACGDGGAPDAYGNFEALEVVVASQTAGPIQQFLATEGQSLAAGAVAAVIDTTALALDRQQLTAQRAAVLARQAEVAEQLRVLEVQREVAARVFERTKRLREAQAATAQQFDQADRDLRTVLAQLEAAKAQQRSVGLEGSAVEARVEQARDRVSRGTVSNPIAGTVLATYARVGEMVNPGQPLYKIAALDTLELRAYLTGDQLGAVTIGQTVDVHIQDGRDGLRTLQGTVSWIASQSEFTPTPVQTRDERSDLVYAMKVRVPNPSGVLKIGMPADLTFAKTAPQ